jgi:hypothetical protein
MKLIKSKKPRKCIKGCDIWSNTYYYKLRKNKSLCFECKNKKELNLWLTLKENAKNVANMLGSIL